MDLQNLTVILLAMVGIGGVVYSLVLPRVTGDLKSEERFAQVAGSGADKSPAKAKAGVQRKDIEAYLKEIEARGKNKAPSLRVRLDRAGLESWDENRYRTMGIILAGVMAVIAFLLSGNLMIGLVGIPVGLFGMPKWIVSYLGNKRKKEFIAKFPDAIDVIVRGLKAGLPLNDTIRIVANEAASPVKEEFLRLVEIQSVGLSIAEAVEKLANSISSSETSFFANVIQIQQKSGGNLSEALGNLSKVLRDRKKMREKIVAISSEATTSAFIIGGIPFIVGIALYFTSPEYISIMWTNSIGKVVLVICAIWMTIGAFVMKKMINFDI